MPRTSPPARRDNEEITSRYREDRQDRYPRIDDGNRSSRRDSYRDDHYGRGSGREGRTVRDRDGRRRNDGRERDGARARDRDREDDRSYGREAGRDGDRRRHRDDGEDQRRRDRDDRDSERDPRRAAAGPSRRSASPRSRRSAKPGSRSPSSAAAAEDKAKPNFGASGLLAAATKTVQHGDGTKTVLKYHEPPEARKPAVGWRLYVFKGKEQVDLLHIQRQSAYLVGRDKAVVDIAVEHPSCSKQHAVIQYRQVQEKNEFGDVKASVKPFVIDLESTNGTIVNDAPIPTSRYYELMAGDVIKFGESAREYVLLSEDAA